MMVSNRNLLFQGSIFRGAMLVLGRVVFGILGQALFWNACFSNWRRFPKDPEMHVLRIRDLLNRKGSGFLLLRAEILHHLGWCLNPINNGINYQPQLVLAGFQPSTVGILALVFSKDLISSTIPANYSTWRDVSGYLGSTGILGGNSHQINPHHSTHGAAVSLYGVDFHHVKCAAKQN